jgi:hypothetical protein
MTVVPLRLDPGSQARVLLNHALEHGDIAGRDVAGRTVIALAVDDWLLDQLLAFDAGAEDLEDGGDDEPNDDAEEDGRPSASDLDTVPCRVILCRHRTEQEHGLDGSPLVPRHAHLLHRVRRRTRAVVAAANLD